VYERRREYYFRNHQLGETVLPPNLVRSQASSCESRVVPAWASAANPFSTQTKFAVGYSGRVAELPAIEGMVASATIHPLNDDIFSVDWLDQNTIISGGRRGNVNLWDTRSGGGCMRFKYPVRINYARKLEGPRIAITGLNESVRLSLGLLLAPHY
jgi:hypothetical protein